MSLKHATCTDFVAKSRITTPRELQSLFSGNEHQRHRTRTTRSHTSTIVPERLAERVWFPNKFQSSFSFLNIVFRDRAGVGLGGGGVFSTPTYIIRMVIFFLYFYFGYPDLSLATQARFSNLTILNTHKQRKDKLCLIAVANKFVALNLRWLRN